MRSAAAATSPGSVPRFSFANTYDPPLDAYALIPWRYERTTIASNAEMPIEIGKTRWRDESDTATRTASAASVA
ncbi:MAG: hypothetical protein E6G32_11460 [Actinobacteria bacterium]|nr:MAG: hypothetical protein E6G32_11460 [Actinomycetota bacterium]